MGLCSGRHPPFDTAIITDTSGFFQVVNQKFKPMFPDDPGEEQVRATVHGWVLTRESV